MPEANKRLRYFNRQFLQEQDFRDEQAYHLDRLRRHNRQLHTWGIAEGLTIDGAAGADRVVVEPGTALDAEGRQIVLDDRRTLPLGGFSGQWVLVVISFAEVPADPAALGASGETRWLERPDVKLVVDNAGAPPRDLSLRLARLRVSGDGKVAEQDWSVRTSAGVKMSSEATLERLNVMKAGLTAPSWPSLSSGEANRLDLQGSLTVTGTVDGRDIAQDGAKLDAHVATTGNPHGTTAQQVGALASVGGISNPGGNVEITGGNGVSIETNATAKQIKISASLQGIGGVASIAGVSNPGGNIAMIGDGGIKVTADDAGNQIKISTTLTDLGATASIAGVSNAGGDIALASNGTITIEGDNASNRISLSTSAAALGALEVGNYLRRGMAHVTLNNTNWKSSFTHVPIGFQPKVIWGQGYAKAALRDGYSYGGVTSCLATVESESVYVQKCIGSHIRRHAGPPYYEAYPVPKDDLLAYVYFIDYPPAGGTEIINAWIQLEIHSILADGFNVKFFWDKHPYNNYSAPSSFSIEMTFMGVA